MKLMIVLALLFSPLAQSESSDFQEAFGKLVVDLKENETLLNELVEDAKSIDGFLTLSSDGFVTYDLSKILDEKPTFMTSKRMSSNMMELEFLKVYRIVKGYKINVEILDIEGISIVTSYIKFDIPMADDDLRSCVEDNIRANGLLALINLDHRNFYQIFKRRR